MKSWWIDEAYYPGPVVSESELQLAGETWSGVTTRVNVRDVVLAPTTSHPRGAIVHCAENAITSFIMFNDIDGVREYTEYRFFYEV